MKTSMSSQAVEQWIDQVTPGASETQAEAQIREMLAAGTWTPSFWPVRTDRYVSWQRRPGVVLWVSEINTTPRVFGVKAAVPAWAFDPDGALADKAHQARQLLAAYAAAHPGYPEVLS